MRLILALAVGLLTSSISHATSLKDFWQSRSPDAPRFESPKTLANLEMCIGMELSEDLGMPVVLHGESETIITSVTGGIATVPLGGVRITDHGSSRDVFVGAKSGLTDKVSKAVQRCV